MFASPPSSPSSFAPRPSSPRSSSRSQQPSTCASVRLSLVGSREPFSALESPSPPDVGGGGGGGGGGVLSTGSWLNSSDSSCRSAFVVASLGGVFARLPPGVATSAAPPAVVVETDSPVLAASSGIVSLPSAVGVTPAADVAPVWAGGTAAVGTVVGTEAGTEAGTVAGGGTAAGWLSLAAASVACRPRCSSNMFLSCCSLSVSSSCGSAYSSRLNESSTPAAHRPIRKTPLH